MNVRIAKGSKQILKGFWLWHGFQEKEFQNVAKEALDLTIKDGQGC